MIDLNNVTVLKSGRKLFENFSLKIAPGEHWLIEGHNGSGKTTLLELIAGLLPAACGEIRYDFITTSDWQERYDLLREKILFVPANALHTFLNGHELFYQQRYYSMGDPGVPTVKDFLGDVQRFSDNTDFPATFRIENLLDLELTRLSNGQLKKVFILKRFQRSAPKFLLLDYPFEGLDKESRSDLADFIDRLATAFDIQIILTDHHHQLPKAINYKVVLENFKAVRIEKIASHLSSDKVKHENGVNKTETLNTVPVVELKNLTIQYGGNKIISNFSWRINKGERWALTGKNGSGKTTLFSLIYADHPMAYSQQVFLFGRRRGTGESIWDIKNRINYLGPEQIHFLNPASAMVTGRQFIVDGMRINEKNLKELTTLFSADPFIDLPLRWLSSGALQIVLFMKCLMKDKELLLLDEPFQFLDAENKKKAVNYLNIHLSAETTLVLITHYEDDLAQWTQNKMCL